MNKTLIPLQPCIIKPLKNVHIFPCIKILFFVHNIWEIRYQMGYLTVQICWRWSRWVRVQCSSFSHKGSQWWHCAQDNSFDHWASMLQRGSQNKEDNCKASSQEICGNKCQHVMVVKCCWRLLRLTAFEIMVCWDIFNSFACLLWHSCVLTIVFRTCLWNCM